MDKPIVRQMLKLANVQAADHVFDIGCGDGRILLASAALGARATGLELDSSVAALARHNIRAAGADVESRVSVIESDARKADITKASVITLYLSERGNKQLLPILNPHLLSRPATRVVSFLFPMPTWTPVKTELTEQSNIPMYLYSGESLPETVKENYKPAPTAETTATETPKA